MSLTRISAGAIIGNCERRRRALADTSFKTAVPLEARDLMRDILPLPSGSRQIFSSHASVSTEDLPDWILSVSLSRFRLARKATDGRLTCQARGRSGASNGMLCVRVCVQPHANRFAAGMGGMAGSVPHALVRGARTEDCDGHNRRRTACDAEGPLCCRQLLSDRGFHDRGPVRVPRPALVAVLRSLGRAHRFQFAVAACRRSRSATPCRQEVVEAPPPWCGRSWKSGGRQQAPSSGGVGGAAGSCRRPEALRLMAFITCQEQQDSARRVGGHNFFKGSRHFVRLSLVKSKTLVLSNTLLMRTHNRHVSSATFHARVFVAHGAMPMRMSPRRMW